MRSLSAKRLSALLQVRRIAASMTRAGFLFGLMALGIATHAAQEAQEAQGLAGQSQSKRADFKGNPASVQARHLANWTVDSSDHQGMPFAIVDKLAAQVFVFGADGVLRGTAAVLLGLAVGDEAVPGIGDRKLSSIRQEERTTPAGRFVAALDRNLRGGEILWVDYDTAISLHPVVTSNSKERRAERLATPSPLDNRISYGCINVPVDFFRDVVRTAFSGTNGVVYVLPETRSVQSVFSSYDVAERERERFQAAGQSVPIQVDPPVASNADPR